MRVLHVIPSMTVSYGGPSHALAVLTEALKKEGIDCDIAAVGSEEDLNVSCPASIRFFKSTWPHFFYFSNKLRVWLDKHVNNYDLVHVHSMFSFPSIVACRAALRHGTPYIIRPFGTLDAISRQQHLFRKMISYQFLEKANLRSAARIQVTSMRELRELNGLGFHGKCALIPLGLELDRTGSESSTQSELFPEGDADSKVIVSLSRINPRKGIDILIQAMARICRDRKDVFLVIAGTGDPAYVSYLKALCSKMKIERHVIWHGEASGERKKSLLSRADVFALISHGESFGLSVVEALSAGAPVVISDQVAICDEVSAAGAGVVVKRDPKDVADAIVQLLVNDSMRRNAIACGIQLVREKYDIANSAKRVAEMYAAVRGSV